MNGIPKLTDPARLPLTQLMAMLEAAGWAYKLKSRVLDGERVYIARAWREGHHGSIGTRVHGCTPTEALAGAWRACQRREGRARAAHRRRLKQLELSPEESL